MLYWKGHYYLLGLRRNEAGSTEDVWLVRFPTDVFHEEPDISHQRVRDANPTLVRFSDCDDEFIEYIVTHLQNIIARPVHDGAYVAL